MSKENSPPNWLKLNRVWLTREYYEALNQVEPIRRAIFGGHSCSFVTQELNTVVDVSSTYYGAN